MCEALPAKWDVEWLTKVDGFPGSFHTSTGKVLISGNTNFCSSHRTSRVGSRKVLETNVRSRRLGRHVEMSTLLKMLFNISIIWRQWCISNYDLAVQLTLQAMTNVFFGLNNKFIDFVAPTNTIANLTNAKGSVSVL